MSLRDDEEQRINRYRQVFGTPEGQEVLKDLEHRFITTLSIVPHLANNNPLAVAGIAAQHLVINTVKRWLTLDLAEYLSMFDVQDPTTEENPYAGRDSEPRDFRPLPATAFRPQLDTGDPTGSTVGSSMARPNG